jgi:molecular chaperone DnaK
MVKDAEANAAEDKKKLELVQARNQADAMVHSVKKSLAEHGDKLDAGEKEKIEAALKDAEEALKGDDKADIEAKTEALMTASQKLGEKTLRRQAAAAPPPRRGGRCAGRPGPGPVGQAGPTTTWSTPSSRKSRSEHRAGPRLPDRSRRVRG